MAELELGDLGDFSIFPHCLRQHMFTQFCGESLFRLSIASKTLNTYIYKTIQPKLDELSMKKLLQFERNPFNILNFFDFELASYSPKPYRLIIKCTNCSGWIMSGIWKVEWQPSGSSTKIIKRGFSNGVAFSSCHKCLTCAKFPFN